MTSRKKRIGRLVEHRRRQLEERAQELQESRNRQDSAEKRLEGETTRLGEAEQVRRRLAGTVAQVADWTEAQQWIQTREQYCLSAREELAHASADVGLIHTRTLAARTDLKQMELLDSRLQADELRAIATRERKFEDEHAARRTHARGRGQSGGNS